MTASSRHHYHHPHTGFAGGGSGRLSQALRSFSWPQRKLFLLVFLWTCICLIVFKTSLLGSMGGQQEPAIIVSTDMLQGDDYDATSYLHHHHHQQQHLHLKSLAARAATSLRPALSIVNNNNQGQSQALPLSSLPTLEIMAPEFDLPSATPQIQLNPTYSHRSYGGQQQQQQQQADAPATSQSNVIFSSSSSSSSSSLVSTSERGATISNQNSLSSSDSPPPPPPAEKTSSDTTNTADQLKPEPPLIKSSATSGYDGQQQQQRRQKRPTKQNGATTSSNSHLSPPPPPPKTTQIVGGQCHYQYPNLFDLQFNNIHWQKLVSQANGERASNQQSSSSSSTGNNNTNMKYQNQNSSKPTPPLKPATFYLYNAYYDDRWRAGLPSVRVLAMIDRVHPPPTNCLLWSSKLSSSSSSSNNNYNKQKKSNGYTSNNNNNNNNKYQLRPQSGHIVTRAQFVYAWYPKWGNYEDGLLQPWIVTCPLPREHVGLVPESVSLVDVPAEVVSGGEDDADDEDDENYTANVEVGGAASQRRHKRHLSPSSDGAPFVPSVEMMPPSFSSSSSSSSSSSVSSAAQSLPQLIQQQQQQQHSSSASNPQSTSVSTTPHARQEGRPARPKRGPRYDCNSIGFITNNLPVFNRRPAGGKREKFAVCVKGLDFPFDGPESRVSIRLVEWIEMLNLLGAKKIFLYNLDVHENISKVLNYYQQRGLVELSPLTLPGDQPNLPEYQHLYLKQRLTSKRQNELIPYNDCLYRNLYSYEYLALLDIDELIMPLKRGHTTWYDLMGEVERMSLSEQNYSRASYNVRNVYFFDDLSGPLGTTQANTQPLASSSSSSSAPISSNDIPDENQDQDQDEGSSSTSGDGAPASDDEPSSQSSMRPHRDSAERGIPHYLHMMSHVYRSKNYTEPGQYVKCFHNTDRVVSLHNHFPMNCFGQCTTYSIPLDLAHLQHYRKDCVGPLRQSCKNDFRLFTTRDTTIWRYKTRMIRRTTRVLNHLQLLTGGGGGGDGGQ